MPATPGPRYSLSHLLTFSSTMALSHRLGQSNPLLCSHQDFATTVRILKPSSGHDGHTGVKFEPMEDSPLPTCPYVHLVELLLLLLLDTRVLPLQGVDVRGHPLHHHTVEGRVVFTSTGIDGSRAQLRNVVGPQALFLTRFCPRGKEHKVSGGDPAKGNRFPCLRCSPLTLEKF